MTYQSESMLEELLIKELTNIGYKYVNISSEGDILKNLKFQLGWLNETIFSEHEFELILHHLNKGSVFERAATLRNRMPLLRDDGSSIWVKFLEIEKWCQNYFQISNQITIEGTYKNRYDVTLLINGLPLVQIELKRRGIELKEAFNQIKRYHHHSYGSSYGLFQFVQIFVVSNGVNSKYYANDKDGTYKQTFYWTDKDNHIINQLEFFTRSFLEPCHISKMITKYVVLNQNRQKLMVLRPYQYYAIEAIVNRVSESDKFGYIWHTTGSGKTLTSFKAAQILTGQPNVHKVMFVVDRKDLDSQTSAEFNHFSPGCVDSTNNTSELVSQMDDDNVKLIVTTIQKLNHAIHKDHFREKIDHLKDKRIVFIFDECHRSQFGETHVRIRRFFSKAQLFGFTGTPILATNAKSYTGGVRTTAELFDDCLHKYVITDAIRDENVLRFSIEYMGSYQEKEKDTRDVQVYGIDTKEVLESEERIRKICEYIVSIHDRKTHNREFNAILACSSIEVLIKYYRILREMKIAGDHDIKFATVFSYTSNEEDPADDGMGQLEEVDVVNSSGVVNKYSREHLEEFIGDYNTMFKTAFSTKESQSFYNYYNDISNKMKSKNLDLLLVVNMFLTGFDAPKLNTLYVDKNLVYHGLIQAYSRTNRLDNERKSQGNIVAFRNLKEATDEALALFSNKNAKETVFVAPYRDLVKEFNTSFQKLLSIAPSPNSIDDYETEEQRMEFVVAFRVLIRILNVLKTFVEFSYNDLSTTEMQIANYQSKYVELYDSTRTSDKVSILKDIDFELQLLRRDEITVSYILRLIALYKDMLEADKERFKKNIEDQIQGTPQLSSKRTLIVKFIEEQVPTVPSAELIEEAFKKYWAAEKENAFKQLCAEENLDSIRLEETIKQYLFSEKLPLPDDIIALLPVQPSVLKWMEIYNRVTQKIVQFVDIFINDQPE